MYICGLIQRNFAEFAEAVPIESNCGETFAITSKNTALHVQYNMYLYVLWLGWILQENATLPDHSTTYDI